ncbi:hypothetical protein [Enterobacter sp.]|uniref:hypothetical protein n=1 Tax=Enterobacter sp. TaxID=42895 RepID=UPI00296E9485|nr:hypothetical protein [Enterobacter sp.]
MTDMNDLNTGETKGVSIHLNAQTVLRRKQYRLDHLKAHPGKPLPGVAQIVRHAVNAWLDESGFSVTEGVK